VLWQKELFEGQEMQQYARQMGDGYSGSCMRAAAPGGRRPGALASLVVLLVAMVSPSVEGATVAITGTFYGAANVTDEDLQLASGYNLTLTLTGTTWQPDIVTKSVRRSVLLESVIASDTASSVEGFDKAWSYQYGYVLTADHFVYDNSQNTVLTINFPAFPTYALPAMGMERIRFAGVPSYCITGSSDVSTVTAGGTYRNVLARTATFGGTFFSPNQLIDKDLRGVGGFTVTISLFAATWDTDVASDETKRMLLVNAVFASNRNATADSQYSYALLAQLNGNTSAVSLTRESDSSVRLTLAKLPAYELPGDKTELIDTAPIPHQVISSQRVLGIKQGRYNMTLVPRVASYSGTFFADTCGTRCTGNVSKTDEHIRSTVSFSVTIQLTHAEWHSGIASSAALREALAKAVFASNKNTTMTGYERGLQYLTESFLCTTGPDCFGDDVTRDSNTQITLRLPAASEYLLPPMGVESVQSVAIPKECLKEYVDDPSSATDLVSKIGAYQVDIHAKSVIYSGSFFSSSLTMPQASDEGIRNATAWSITMTLVAETWHTMIENDVTLRTQIVDAVLASNRAASGDYSHAFVTQRANYASNAFQDADVADGGNPKVARVSDHLIVITVPAFTTYYLPPGGSETITPVALSKDLFVGKTGDAAGTEDLTTRSQSGVFSLYIEPRTVAYSGTFFNATTHKTDDHLRNGIVYYIELVLTHETWDPSVASDPTQREALVAAVLDSSKANTTIHHTYTNAIGTQYTNLSASGVTRTSDTVVRISIPSLPSYVLPAYGMETVTAINIPHTTIGGSMDIVPATGTKSLVIRSRTVLYSGNFFSSSYKLDHLMRSTTSKMVAVSLSFERWHPNLKAETPRWSALLNAVLHSNRLSTESGFGHGLGAHVSNMSADAITVFNSTYLEIHIPQMHDYRLPGNQTETITPQALPAVTISTTTEINVMTGTRSLEIRPRTAHYYGTFYDPTVAHFDTVASTDVTPHITKYRTGEQFQIRNFTLYIKLIDDTWLSDVATNSAKRQAVIDAAFTSTKSDADLGYETAFRKLVENFPQGNFVRYSDTILLLHIPVFPSYSLPIFGSEVIAATTIPSSTVTSGMDVLTQIAPTTTDGTQIPSIRVQARTMSFSGTFFHGLSQKLDEYVRDGNTYTIVMTLSSDKWVSNVASNVTIRQSLIDSVLSSNRSLSERGYEDSIAKQRQHFLSYPMNDGHFVRDSDYRLTITVPQLVNYALPGYGSELIRCTELSSLSVMGSTGITLQNGTSSLHVVPRTAFYSGTFFETAITDALIRSPITYSIVITLRNDTWQPDVVTNGTKRQALINAVLRSDRSKVDAMYHFAMEASIENYAQSNVNKQSDTTLTITVPQFATYYLPALGTESVQAQPIPSDVIMTSTSIPAKEGLSLLIMAQARTAMYSGSFFSNTLKLDEDLRSTGTTWDIVIDLFADGWNAGVASDALLRQDLVSSILHANHTDNADGIQEGGFSGAINYAVRNFSNASLLRYNDTRVVITVLGLSDYRLPGSETETIVARWIPRSTVGGMTNIGLFTGLNSVTVKPRYVTYSGTFFTSSSSVSGVRRGDADLRSSTTYTVIAQLTDDTWVSDIATNSQRYRALLRAIFSSSRSNTSSGYENAIETQVYEAYPTGLVNRVSNTRVTLTVPAFAAYAIPALSYETITAGAIPAECVSSTTSLPSKLGLYSVVITARTATYSGTFFQQAGGSNVSLPGYGTRLDEDIRSNDTWSVNIDLSGTGAAWATDVVTNALTRQALIDSVFSSSRIKTEQGYEKAIQKQIESFPPSPVLRVNDTRVMISLPPMSDYVLPLGGFEDIGALGLPGEAFQGNVPIALRAGEYTTRVRPRTCTVSGTFFAGRSDLNTSYKTDANIREASHTVVLTLGDDTWATNAATDAVVVQALIDKVLYSNQRDLSSGSAYSKGLHHHIQSFPASNVVRNSETVLTITVPPYANYTTVAMGKETITVTDIPSQALGSTSDITAIGGYHSIQIRTRTAVFSGSIFGSEYQEIGDNKIIANEPPLGMIVDLYGDLWHPDIATNTALKRTLVSAMFRSNKSPSDSGYSYSFAKMRDMDWTGTGYYLMDSAAGIPNLVRYNATRVIITLSSSYSYYRLPGGGSEVISVSDVPASVLQDSNTIQITQKQGTRQVRIIPRTVVYSGTFFTSEAYGTAPEGEAKTDADMRSATNYTIIAKILNDTWASDIDTNSSKRQALIKAIIVSNRYDANAEYTAAGYETAMVAQVVNFPQHQVVRNADDLITITILPMESYALFPMAWEQISAGAIPALCVNSDSNVYSGLGPHRLTIHARTIRYSGSFYDHSVVGLSNTHTDETLRSAHNFSVRVDLVAETWVSNVVSDSTRRQELISAVFVSNRSLSDPGYDQAFRAASQAYNASLITLHTNQSLTITVPSLPLYALVAGATERLSTGDLPASLLGGWGSGGELRGKAPISFQETARRVDVIARTVTYSGSFFSLDPKNDENIQDSTISTISLRLAGEHWLAPINGTAWEKVAQQIFATDRNNSVGSGYEHAMRHHALSFSMANFAISSDKFSLTVTVPQYAGYKLPPLGVETFETLAIPAGSVTGQEDIPLKLGVSTLVVAARTAIFSGTFFGAAGDVKLDESLRSTQTWSIGVRLVADTWVHDVHNNTVIRQTLIDALLASSAANSLAGQGLSGEYNKSMTVQRQAFLASNIERRNQTTILITIPQYADYELPGGGEETITASAIPPSALGGLCCPIRGVSPLLLHVGERSVRIIPRTVTYSGTFFEASTTPTTGRTTVAHDTAPFDRSLSSSLFKSDENLRESPEYTIILTLSNDTWHANVHDHSLRRQYLIDAVLKSSVAKSVPGYALGMDGVTDDYNASLVTRDSETQVTITLPPLTQYWLPPLGEEVIAATDLPHAILGSSTDLTAKLGPRSSWLRARTSLYSGSFFSSNKTDELMQLSTTYTIHISLVAAKWDVEVATNATKRQALVDRVTSSSHGPTFSGLYPTISYRETRPEDYKDSMIRQRVNYPQDAVVRVDDWNVTVTVVQMQNYKLPSGGQEKIEARALPAIALQGVSDISLQVGDVTTVILARTLHISGTFYTDTPKSDAMVIGGANLTVVLDLIADSWVSDIATEASQRQGVIKLMLASQYKTTQTGYSKAFAHQIQNFPSSSIERLTETRVVITIPPFSGYSLPGCSIEPMSVAYLNNRHVEGLTAIALTMGKTKTEILGKVSPPTFVPTSMGPYTTELEVSLNTCSDFRGIRSTAYFSLDGKTPSIEYKKPFKIYRTTSIRSFSRKPGHVDSDEFIMNYTLRAAAPVFCPPGGNFTGIIEHATITSSTPDVQVHYTTDGSTPSGSSPLILPWSWLDWTAVGTYSFKAVAIRGGVAQSDVTTANYTVTAGAIATQHTVTPTFQVAGVAVEGGSVMQGSTLDIVVPAPDDDAAVYWTAEVGEFTQQSGKQPSLCEKPFSSSGGGWRTALPGRVSVQFSISAGRSLTIKAMAAKTGGGGGGQRISALKVATFFVVAQNQFEIRTARSKLVLNTKKPHAEDITPTTL